MEEEMQSCESPEHLDIPEMKEIIFSCWRKYTPTRKEKYKEFADWDEKDKVNFSSVRSVVPYNMDQANKYEKDISGFFDTVQQSMRQEETPVKQKDAKLLFNEILEARGRAIHTCLSATKIGRQFPLPWEEQKIKSLYNKRIQIRATSDPEELIPKRKKSLIFWGLFLDYIESKDFVSAMRSKETALHRPTSLKKAITDYTKETKLPHGTQLDLFIHLAGDIGTN